MSKWKIQAVKCLKKKREIYKSESIRTGKRKMKTKQKKNGVKNISKRKTCRKYKKIYNEE